MRAKKSPRDKAYKSDKLIHNLKWEAIEARIRKDNKCLVREKPIPKHWM